MCRRREKRGIMKTPDVGQSEDIQKQFLSIRTIEENAFNSIHVSLAVKIDAQLKADEPLLVIIKDELLDLKRQLDVCKQAHHKYVASLVIVPPAEIVWVAALQDKSG